MLRHNFFQITSGYQLRGFSSPSEMADDANQKVIFSAIRKTDHVNEKDWVTYDEADVNEGGGMNIGTGYFTVPVSGIYSFSFGGMTKYEGDRTSVLVMKNGTSIFTIFDNSESIKDHPILSMSMLSTTWVMNLTQNDVISLFTYNGELYVSPNHLVFFNGHLLKRNNENEIK